MQLVHDSQNNCWHIVCADGYAWCGGELPTAASGIDMPADDFDAEYRGVPVCEGCLHAINRREQENAQGKLRLIHDAERDCWHIVRRNGALWCGDALLGARRVHDVPTAAGSMLYMYGGIPICESCAKALNAQERKHIRRGE